MGAECSLRCLMLTSAGSPTCAFCIRVVPFIHVCVDGGHWRCLGLESLQQQPSQKRVGVV